MQSLIGPLLLDRAEVCLFFGGTKPIDPATLYRGIRKGRYPSPVKKEIARLLGLGNSAP
jgi:hypothetical protein